MLFVGLSLAQSFFVPMTCYLDTGSVDIVFCMDTSRSMEPYIEDLQNNIVEFVDSITARGYDFRLGAVPFDDSTNVWDFDPAIPGNQMTSNVALFHSWLSGLNVSLIASDSWEVSLDAIYDALMLYQWREDALKIIVMFTNEGYHSLGDGSGFSDVTFTQVRDTVLSHGAVVFIAASSRPACPAPGCGSPIPAAHRANLILLANSSGGYLDSLTADWTFILDRVVDLISTFTSVTANIQNLTGAPAVINAYLDPIETSCMSIRSANPVSSPTPIPNGNYYRAFWKVIVDSTCESVERCFELPVWAGSVSDTFFGCITDELCYGYTDADFNHLPPTFTTSCINISPNPATINVEISNDGIRPLTGVSLTFEPISEHISITGGDPNPMSVGEVSYFGTEEVNWLLHIGASGGGVRHDYRIRMDYAEGTSIVRNYSINVPNYQTPPSVAITRGDTILCPGDEIMLEASVTPTGTWSYEWFPLAGLDNPNIATPFASPLTTTRYTVNVTDGFDCFGTNNITVVVLDSVFAEAGRDTTIFPGRMLRLGGYPSGWGGYGSLSYEWNPPFGLSDPFVPNPIVYPFFPAEYILTVTDAGGCIAQDTVQINIQPPLGYILVQDEEEIIELRVIDTLEAMANGNGMIMVAMPGGFIGAADLADSTDTWASPVLIQTNRGIRSWRHKIFVP